MEIFSHNGTTSTTVSITNCTGISKYSRNNRSISVGFPRAQKLLCGLRPPTAEALASGNVNNNPTSGASAPNRIRATVQYVKHTARRLGDLYKKRLLAKVSENAYKMVATN
ncbi:MAG TPA: hypothetical protein VI603_05100 [Saprospiraceae bacterium]|nr:hypothetical protein [Saprospiraceae bacterium]